MGLKLSLALSLQDEASLRALCAALNAMQARDEAAVKVVALSVDDASACLPLLKPGLARASLLAMPVSQAALVMEGCTPEELGVSLSALVRHKIG